MNADEYGKIVDGLNAGEPTPDLSTFRACLEYDDNFYWRIPTGHITNALDAALAENAELREQNDNLIHQIERLTMGRGSLQGQLEQARAYSIERITELKADIESEREAIVQALEEVHENYLAMLATVHSRPFDDGYLLALERAIAIVRSFSSEGER